MQYENKEHDCNYWHFPRKMIYHPIFKDHELFAFWVYLKSKAQFTDHSYTISKVINNKLCNKKIMLNKGQLVFSPKKIAMLFSVSERTPHKWLDRLVKYNLIKKNAIKGWCTIVTITPNDRVKIDKGKEIK